MFTVIKGGLLIDGTGSSPVENSLVLIEDKHITYVGEMDETQFITGAEEYEIIDASGSVVMPGIVDCNVYLSGILGDNELDGVLESNIQQAIVSVTDAESLINYGVTTVIDVSQNGLHLKHLVQSGKYIGPRIFSCGRGLCRLGGDMDRSGFPQEVVQEMHPWAVLAEGIPEIRKAIRKLVREDGDCVNIWVTSQSVQNPGESKRTKERLQYSYDELKTVVEEAEFVQMPVFAHCDSPQGTKDALAAGVRNIIRGKELDEKCLELMKQNNAVFLPILKTTLDGLSNNTAHIRVREIFKKMIEMKIKIAVASGTFNRNVTPYGITSLQELYTMADAGMNNMDIIVAATKTGAEIIDANSTFGTIEQGKSADLLVLEKNPLDDIRNLSPENMSLIMQNGQLIKSDTRYIAYV